MFTSLWASTASWFTPTILFCIMNLIIAIIFIASNFKTRSKQHTGEYNSSGQLVRASSLLDRVKSINFSLYQFPPETHSTAYQPQYEESSTGSDQHESRIESSTEENSPGQLVRTPSLLERVRSINFSLYKTQQPDPFPPEIHYTDSRNDQTHDEDEHSMGWGNHVTRSKSDTCGEIQASVQVKMKKSASEKAMVETREEVERRRPATVRGGETSSSREEDGVDAKADDFINRFRQQLKLQRLDSFSRYKEMLSRGTD